jgi:hypothetical protein
VKLRCRLLSLLRIHRPDCQRCAREKAGDEMRKRLEDLNWRTQPHSNNDVHGGVIEVIDSKLGEVLSPPISGGGARREEEGFLASTETHCE